MLIFANKQDLQFCMEADEIIDSLDLNKIKDRFWNIVACSAKTQKGLTDGFMWLKEIMNSTLL